MLPFAKDLSSGLKRFARFAAAAAFACSAPHIAHSAPAAQPPNVVLILVDDYGWADLGCYGSRFYETPNMDRLARQGMRFTNAYAACAVCSPSRAAIQTGLYPARLHLTDWIPGEGDNHKGNALLVPNWTKYLSTSYDTLAKALARQGYFSGSIGKWHLGGKEITPQAHGFQVNVGGGTPGHPPTYFWPYKKKGKGLPGLEEGGHPGEYLNDRLTSEAVTFIRQNKQKPFFLYLAHYAVHVPLEAKPEMIAKYKAKPNDSPQKNPTYAAMVESVDQGIGRVLDALDEQGLTSNTLVLLTSDNGGLWPNATCNAPLRAGKCYPYEGGIRVPLIVRWPGRVAPGSQCSEPVSGMDFYPTLMQAVGTAKDTPTSPTVDGVSLMPLLTQTGSLKRDALYWHYPHYWHGDEVRPWGAVRAGNWKLIEFYEDMRVELYDLSKDPSEKSDLAASMPAKASELREKLHAWRKSVDAQMPLPNPKAQDTNTSR